MSHSRRAWQLLSGLAITLFAVSSIPKASAGTWTDVESLIKEINNTGTSVTEETCSDKNIHGFYELEKDKVDQITICVDNIDKEDPDQYWETLAHEATHVMQACTGDHALNDSYISRAYRELQSINTTSVSDIQAYGSWNKRQEIEARWMEFQDPLFVIEILKGNCSKDQ